MTKPNQEGEKHLKLDNIQFPFHPKPKTKDFLLQLLKII
jgi:hypothetical protein